MRIASGFDPNYLETGSLPDRNPATPEEISTLIDSLADSDWKTRSKATRRLIEIGDPALPALREASNSDPLEGAWRAEEAIQEIDRRRNDAARASLPEAPR